MLSSLPTDILLSLATFITLPYFLTFAPDEQWSLLSSSLPPNAVKPGTPQIACLWRYWNYHRFHESKLGSAIQHGLRYVPLIRHYLQDLFDSSDHQLVLTIIATHDYEFYLVALSSLLEVEAEQLRFNDKFLAMMVEEAMSAPDPRILEHLLRILGEVEDEPFVERCYALRQACRSYFNRPGKVMSNEAIRRLRNTLRAHSYDEERSLPQVVLSAYGTRQHRFFEVTLPLLTNDEKKELLSSSPELRRLLQRREVKAIELLLQHGDVISFFKSLLSRELKWDSDFYRQIFALAYRPEIKFGQLLAESPIYVNDVSAHQRLIEVLKEHEDVVERMGEFVVHLKRGDSWSSGSLITVLKLLNPEVDAERVVQRVI